MKIIRIENCTQCRFCRYTELIKSEQEEFDTERHYVCAYPIEWATKDSLEELFEQCPLEDEFKSYSGIEEDPHGIDAHAPGAKLDAGKLQASLLLDFSRALTKVAEVCTYGAKKYSRGGWQYVDAGVSRYKDAAMRHMLKGQNERTDEESGLLHEAQVIWNLLASLELKLREEHKGGIE